MRKLSIFWSLNICSEHGYEKFALLGNYDTLTEQLNDWMVIGKFHLPMVTW